MFVPEDAALLVGFLLLLLLMREGQTHQRPYSGADEGTYDDVINGRAKARP